jgi:hypothetical protein
VSAPHADALTGDSAPVADALAAAYRDGGAAAAGVLLAPLGTQALRDLAMVLLARARKPRAVPSPCRNPACGKARQRQPDGRLEGSRGLCRACYSRWRRAGHPDEVPGPVSGAERAERARQSVREAMRACVADYAELRSWGVGREEAARRAGISVRRSYDYDARLRQERASHAA